MVSRDAAAYAGHFGRLATLGLPVRAKATQDALTLVASSYASDIFEMSGPAILMLLNTNGISIVCGDRMWPPPSGVSQSKRYRYAGAPACAALRLAVSRA